MAEPDHWDIVFTMTDPREFISMEDQDGPIKMEPDEGQWFCGPDGYWRLRLYTQPTLDDMAQDIHDVSTAHGFDAPDVDNFPAKLMLSVTELAEAMEEFRDDKPPLYYKCQECGFETVDPDPFIRSGQHWPEVPDNWWGRIIGSLFKRPLPCNGNSWKPEGAAIEIADSNIRNLHMMKSMWPDLDVDKVHEIKLAFNKGRPMNHGRVKSL